MNTSSVSTAASIRWQFVFIFYAIAFIISAFFNSGFFAPQYQRLTQGLFFSDLTYLPACLGTFLAALAVFRWDRTHRRTISFFGNASLKNIIISVTPVAVFSVVGLDNNTGQNIHLFAALYGSINLNYATLEEIGWRGYLLDALRPLKATYRFLIIGLLWWAWHFRFTTAFDFTIFPLLIVGASFLIGKFTEETKSYFAAAGLHCVIILMTNSGDVSQQKLIAGVLTILIWIGIGHWWKSDADPHCAS
jgi:uncharacterized protein